MKPCLAAVLLGVAVLYPAAAVSQTDEQTLSRTQTGLQLVQNDAQDTRNPMGEATKDMYGLSRETGVQNEQPEQDAEPQMAEISASDIQDRTAVNETGEEIGEIIRVVRDGDGTKYIVVTFGGILGFGEKHILRSTEQVRMRDDEVVISLTDVQLSKLPHWEGGPGYEDVSNSETLRIQQDT